MTEIKKYSASICILIILLGVLVGVVDLFVTSYNDIFSKLLIALFVTIVGIIVFSTIVTYFVVMDKKVNSNIMKINFKIVNLLFPIVTYIASMLKISKDEMRRVYIKLNNEYIYSGKYNFDAEDIIILIPHCVQNNSCKLKITNDIDNCNRCGLCSVNDLVELKNKQNVKVFVATGGTLARKIIVDNKPKAVIAVACERDLTSGVQDVSKMPVLGVFNKRPNGPCFNTGIDIEDVENAIKFLRGNVWF
ncbi:DUF116 domain-containing protein [Clostridioides mangenotii]|uniref:DUF116 domain-containing protein n=1 Tax=Metaclostridioides mangenotii TaxID=1540 RepID=UPI001C1061CB|nr:DUF116 domain-containing protein [Clostridioides mangenotii]MBU5306681.1 DUF116 domain-containing protein [Clostridioides mangenotii]